MEIKKVTVNGKTYEFVNDSRSTRSGFAHDTTLLVDGIQKISNTCHYLNRTWECYRYQTVMCGAMSQLKDNRRKYLENKFKEEKGYSRLTEKRRLELEDVFTADKFLNEYEEVLKNLRNY